MIYDNKVWYKSFEETLNKGEVGEKVFLEVFKKLDNCVVYDVRELESCQKRDIDFNVFFYDKEFKQHLVMFEVKTEFSYGKYAQDKQRYFIEDISSQKQNSDGWYRYTQCDVIVNYDAVNNMLYMFKFKDLKEYIDSYYKSDCIRVDYVKLKYGAAGYVVNIKKFFNWLQDKDKFNIELKGVDIDA